jgi:hypothetical protein
VNVSPPLQHLEHFLWWLVNSKDFWQITLATGIGAIIAAAAGAYIGGKMATQAALKAQKQAAKDQRERDAEADRRAVDGTLRAISAELRVLKAQPLTHLTKTLADREQMRTRFPNQVKPLAITQTNPNRFIVFESNGGLLGRIGEDELIQHIVAVYSSAKQLVDQVNAIARDFDRWRTLQDGDPEKQVVRNMIDGLEIGLRNGLPTLRSEVDNLLREIDEYLKHS